MSDVFYVVSRESADSDTYTSAVAFNRGDKDADNEGAANDYLAERKAAAPWHSHSVMSADDFDTFSEPRDENASDEINTPDTDGAATVGTD